MSRTPGSWPSASPNSASHPLPYRQTPAARSVGPRSAIYRRGNCERCSPSTSSTRASTSRALTRFFSYGPPTVHALPPAPRARTAQTAGKTVCTVLDFVGTHRKEFRFDRRLGALLGGSRADVERQVRQDFPFLPAGCAFHLDQVAKEIVLQSIHDSIPSTWRERCSEIRSLGDVPAELYPRSPLPSRRPPIALTPAGVSRFRSRGAFSSSAIAALIALRRRQHRPSPACARIHRSGEDRHSDPHHLRRSRPRVLGSPRRAAERPGSPEASWWSSTISHTPGSTRTPRPSPVGNEYRRNRGRRCHEEGSISCQPPDRA